MGQWSATGLYRCHADTDSNGHFKLKAGRPVANTRVWIESDGQKIDPVYHDGYGCIFYLRGGGHVIHAENGSLHAIKPYKLVLDKNNTASGESLETYIQLK